MSRSNKLSRYCTTVARTSNSLVIAYRETIIVCQYCDGSVTLNTGGYLTVTTKRKINQSINEFNLFPIFHVGVYQKKGVWYIHVSNLDNTEAYEMPWDGSSITLDANKGLFQLFGSKAA